MKHKRTLIFSAILFLLACWLLRDTYNIGRNACSGLLNVFVFFVVYVPIILFAFFLFFRGIYRFLWQGKQAVELLPIVIIALFVAVAFTIDSIHKRQDKDLWLEAVSRDRGTRETYVLFRNNNTYTVTDRGPCYGCTWTSTYSKYNDTVIVDVAEKELMVSRYIIFDSILKPATNLKDTLHWLYVERHRL